MPEEQALLPRESEGEVLPFDAAILTGQLCPSSIAMYRRDMHAYLAYAKQQGLDPWQATTFTRWRTRLAEASTPSPHAINRMLSAVKRLLREGAERGTYELISTQFRPAGIYHDTIQLYLLVLLEARAAIAGPRRLESRRAAAGLGVRGRGDRAHPQPSAPSGSTWEYSSFRCPRLKRCGPAIRDLIVPWCVYRAERFRMGLRAETQNALWR